MKQWLLRILCRLFGHGWALNAIAPRDLRWRCQRCRREIQWRNWDEDRPTRWQP